MKAHWTSRLGDIATRQLPFALAQALNDTAKTAAEEARVEAAKRLNVKRSSFLRFFIRNPTEHRATKAKHTARVVTAGPQSDPTRGSILAQHEESGVKTPFSRPLIAKPSREILQSVGGKRSIPRGTALNLFKPFVRDGQATTGRKGAFLVKAKGSGTPVLLQRIGGRVRALYVYVRSTRLTPKLGFGKAVVRVVRRDLDRNIGKRLTAAIASAREVTSGGGRTSSRLPQ